MEREIKPVENKMEKYQTYRKLKGRHSAAIREAFYLEAILIDYALLEDRLRSFMFYMGLISTRESTKVYKKAKSYLEPIVEHYKRENEKSAVGITNIGDKIKAVRCAALWASETETEEWNPYLYSLKRSIENTDIQYLLELLEQIDKWKKYRNEVIHSLMNKNLGSLDEKLAEKAVEGRILAEQLDNQLRLFKKGNLVRKVLKLQDKKG